MSDYGKFNSTSGLSLGIAGRSAAVHAALVEAANAPDSNLLRRVYVGTENRGRQMASVLRDEFAAAAAAAASAAESAEFTGGGGHGSVSTAESAAWSAALRVSSGTKFPLNEQRVSNAEWAQIIGSANIDKPTGLDNSSQQPEILVDEVENKALTALLSNHELDGLILEVWPREGGRHCCRASELTLAQAAGDGKIIGIRDCIGPAPDDAATIAPSLLRAVLK